MLFVLLNARILKATRGGLLVLIVSTGVVAGFGDKNFSSEIKAPSGNVRHDDK